MRDVLEERVLLLVQCEKDIELQQIEVELCTRDILHFFRNYVYTDKNSTLFSSDDPSVLPFVPFPFQEEAITEIWKSIVEGTKSISDRKDLTNIFIEKSRQMGLSWVIVGIYVYGYIFHDMKFLMISQKEDDVDKKGDIKSLMEKCRFIIRNLPRWMIPFLYTYDKDEKKHVLNEREYLKYLNINRPDGTGSITGESANPNASRGGTYHSIFMDEMAFMDNANTINTAASSATPCRIFNSTPNGEGNEFYRMRKLAFQRTDKDGNILPPEVKGLRYHWSEHPLYTREWYEWKIKGMTPEKIAQELEIDYNTAVVGRVYPEFPKEPSNIQYDARKPMYVWIDNSHGGTDPNAIICMQPEGIYWNIIDAIEIYNTPENCAEFLSGTPKFQLSTLEAKFFERYQNYNYRKAIFISDPYDTKSAMGNSTILDDYRKVGINLMQPDRNKSVEERILKTRTNLYRIRYNDNCLDFASSIMNAKYPERKENSNSTSENTKPVHNWTSHFRTALEYGVNYILESDFEYLPKQEQQKQPFEIKNPITGEITIIYQ